MYKFIFIVFSLFVSSISVFSQGALEKDLLKSFKEYDLVKLDSKIVLEKAKTNQPIKVQAYGRYFEFVLTPNDLRANNYSAIESSDSGNREMEFTEVVTYKGVLSNDIGSEVRFTITDEYIEGFISTSDNKKFFVTKAERFSSYAQESDAIVYGENDLLKTIDLSNDTRNLVSDIESKIDFGFDILKPYIDNPAATADKTGAFAAESSTATTADLRVLEVATEADYQWVTQAGGATAANNEILGILNLVDGIYKRDLNLTIAVTFQHAWTTSDSYSTASTKALMDAFLAHWNSNYPASQSQYRRDVAHLFTGKFSNQGIAYQSVTCRNSGYAYGVTARSGSVNHLITAHEIGHTLGAEHIDNSGSCANSIMNPSIGFTATSFCDVSKSQIANYTDSYGSCLNSAGGTTPTPTPTPAVTPTPIPSCTYSITAGNQNFSTFGGTGAAIVATQSGCSWSASSNQSFVSITSVANGSGYGIVEYYVAQNTSINSRTALITIAGQYFTLQQNGVTSNNTTKTHFDFDGDGKADISVFRPSVGAWYVSRSSDSSAYGTGFGLPGDLITPADFDGDGKTDIAVFRPSNGVWYLQRSAAGFTGVQFGQAGDVPMPGDYDGDGKADTAVFRPSTLTWYIQRSSGGTTIQQFGSTGDVPVVADYDGDGRADIAIYRPSKGEWWINRSSLGVIVFQFGNSTDKPVQADYTGDRKADVAFFRPSSGEWFILRSENQTYYSYPFGSAEDAPSPGDYDGDGKADAAVFRPSNNTWFVQKSTSGTFIQSFGLSSDKSVPNAFVP